MLTRSKRHFYFLTPLVTAFFLSCFVILAAHFYLIQTKNNLLEAIFYLEQHLNETQSELATLQTAKQQEMAVSKRVQFINNLKTQNNQLVILIDHIAKLVPPKVSLIILARKNNKITIEGSAHSDLDITDFINNIANLSLFNRPVLTQKNNQLDKKIFLLEFALG